MEIHVINLGGGEEKPSNKESLLKALLESLGEAVKESKGKMSKEGFLNRASEALDELIVQGGGDNFSFQKNDSNGTYFFSFAAASIALNEGKQVTKKSWGALNIYLEKDVETGKIIKHNHLPIGEDCNPYELILEEIEENDWLIVNIK